MGRFLIVLVALVISATGCARIIAIENETVEVAGLGTVHRTVWEGGEAEFMVDLSEQFLSDHGWAATSMKLTIIRRHKNAALQLENVVYVPTANGVAVGRELMFLKSWQEEYLPWQQRLQKVVEASKGELGPV